jgi:hypothetical protein
MNSRLNFISASDRTPRISTLAAVEQRPAGAGGFQAAGSITARLYFASVPC